MNQAGSMVSQMLTFNISFLSGVQAMRNGQLCLLRNAHVLLSLELAPATRSFLVLESAYRVLLGLLRCQQAVSREEGMNRYQEKSFTTFTRRASKF
mgnify:CR=1 FL=1